MPTLILFFCITFIHIGGERNLAYRKQIPVVDLSQWIQKNTSPDDYVLFKLDVEGAEFDILDRMLKDGTFKWIDK